MPETTALLEQLRDIHLPEPVKAWPIAPGWWILFALVLMLLFFFLPRLFSRFKNWLQKRRKHRAFMQQFKMIEQEYLWQKDPIALLENLSVLLKRVALTQYPRARVAPLAGTAWLEFLDQTSSGKQFTEGDGRYLVSARFQKRTDFPEHFPAHKVLETARQWIKQQC